MKLSIIIPCYNEENTIKPLLKALFQINFPIEREIIVVDDGSKKNHKDILNEEIKLRKVKFIRLPKNQGKGVAIRIGLKYAKGDIFIIQDADFEYLPSDIPMLLKPIINGETEVVYGTRSISFSKMMAKSHLFGNRLLTKFTNLLYKTNITDMETGYKVFTKKVLNKIELSAREFEIEPELTSKIIINGFKIKELPINYRYRNFGIAKINILDGFESLIILLKNRYFYDSISFQYLYRIFKFHFKKIGNKLLKAFFFYIRKRL